MVFRAPAVALLVALMLSTSARADVVVFAPQDPSAAIGTGGVAAITWLRRGPKTQSVMLAVRGPRGRFGDPVVIARRANPSSSGEIRLEDARVQVDAAGNVLATWVRVRPYRGADAHGDAEVRERWSRWRLRGGALSGASQVGDASASGQAVLSAAGRAWAIVGGWLDAPRLAAADPGRPLAGEFTIPDVGRDARLAPTDDGGVLVLSTDSGAGRGRLAHMRRDGTAVRSVELFRDEVYPDARLVARPRGGAFVSYARGPELRLVTVPPAGSTATTEIMPGTTLGRRGVVALGAGRDGDLVSLWKRVDNTAGTEALIRDADGRYGPIRALGPAESRNLNPTVAAFGEDGSALAVTRHARNSLSVATRRPGAAFVLGPRLTDPGRGANALPATAVADRSSIVAWIDTPKGIGPPPSRSARLIALDRGADGRTRRLVLDAAVADPENPSAVFAVPGIRPARVDREHRLRLTLACQPIDEDRCDAMVRVRGSRRGAVLARRRVQARPSRSVALRLRLPASVARDIRGGRREALWLTMSATRGRATAALRLRVRP